MRRFSACAVITVVLLGALGTTLRAQVGDCDRDCPDTPPNQWQTYSFVMTLGTCNVEITYRARTNNCVSPPRDEYELVRMFSTNSFQECTNGMPTAQLMKLFIDAMIVHNGPQFSPDDPNDPCNIHSVVSLAVCWVNNIGINELEAWGEMTPCSEGCCFSRYEICFTEARGRYISRKLAPYQDWPGQGTVSCPPLQPPNQNFSCGTFCPTLEMYPLIIEKGTSAPPDLSEAGTHAVCVDGLVTATYDDSIGTVGAIEIVDMRGRVLGRAAPTAARGAVFDARSWPTGSYTVVYYLSDNRGSLARRTLVTR